MNPAEENHFETWLGGQGQELWKILHHPVSGQEDYSEDFLKVLGVSRRRIEKSFRKKGDQHSASKIFLRNWIRRQENPVAWENRLLILGLFYLKWPSQDIAWMLNVSPPALKFRAVRELKKLHFGDSEGPRPLTRDCVRFDLFYIDLALGSEWKDPLHLVPKSTLLQHKKTCPRCREIDAGLQKEVEALRGAEISHTWADRDRELLLRESTGTRRILSFDWFDAMPWYIKTPLQVMLVTAAIMLSLSIPYVGDLFPNLNFRERVSGVWNHIHERVVPTEVAKNETPPTPESIDVVPEVKGPVAANPAAPNAKQVAQNQDEDDEEPAPPTQKAAPVASVKSEPVAAKIPPVSTVAAGDKVAAQVAVERVYLENPDPPMIHPNRSNWKTAGLPKPVYVAPVATEVIVAKAEPVKTAPAKVESKAPEKVALATKATTVPGQNKVVAQNGAGNKAVDNSVDKSAKASTKAEAAPAPQVTSQISGDEALEDPTSEGVGEKVFFRWGAFSKDIEGDNTKIVEILTKYGASAAGEIPLGGEYLGGRYFHFTIARDDFAAMLQEVKALDLIGLTNAKATSSRTTPAKQRRVVFLVRPQ